MTLKAWGPQVQKACSVRAAECVQDQCVQVQCRFIDRFEPGPLFLSTD